MFIGNIILMPLIFNSLERGAINDLSDPVDESAFHSSLMSLKRGQVVTSWHIYSTTSQDSLGIMQVKELV